MYRTSSSIAVSDPPLHLPSSLKPTVQHNSERVCPCEAAPPPDSVPGGLLGREDQHPVTHGQTDRQTCTLKQNNTDNGG